MDSYCCLDIIAIFRVVVSESEEGNGGGCGSGCSGTSSTSRAHRPGPSSVIRKKTHSVRLENSMRSRTVMLYDDDEANDLLELGGLEQIVYVS